MSKQSFNVTLKRVIFESNGFKITKCICNDTGDELTLVGHFMPLYDDEVYIGEGKVTNHPTYGEQLEVISIERTVISDEDKLVDYFASGLFFGIGKKTAQNIVSTVGENVIETILNDDNALDNVKNLSARKAKKFVSKLRELNDTTNTFNYLISLGVNQKIASKLYSDYGDKIKAIIEDDPFKLYYNNSYKYNFKTIYDVAKIVIGEENDIRVVSANYFYYISNHTFNTGNTYVTFDEFKDNFMLEEAIEYLTTINVIETTNDKVMIKEMFDAEKLIARFIKLNSDIDISEIEFDFEEAIEEFSISKSIQFSTEQIAAIRNSFSNKLSIISGGPGTGKTTIVSAICKIFISQYNLDLGESIFDSELMLLAPTGRAAKRMSEQTGLAASTIHRYLRWDIDKNTFEYNESNKAKAKVVIVDEFSMIDTYLFANLIDALNDNVVMIIIGDDMQLPAVGSGDILNDLITSNCVSTSMLNEVFRQNSDSLIGFMHNIRNFIIPSDLTTKYNNRNFIVCNSETLFNSISDVLQRIKQKELGVFDFQLLIPMYKGIVGINSINALCQEIFNPASSSKKEIKIGEIHFRVEDKILLTKNFPNHNVYNGDLGTIKDISFDKGVKIKIKFDDKDVVFAGDEVYSIVHGYAISIHKSQGSEFSHVIIPMSKSHRVMLKHNLIYTAITRAKDSLLIIGEESTFVNAICDRTVARRNTNLLDLISEIGDATQNNSVSPMDFM